MSTPIQTTGKEEAEKSNMALHGKVEEEYKMEYVPIWLRDEREEGIKIGEETKAKETARNLLEMGIETDKIAKATGLKKEEVEKLASISH